MYLRRQMASFSDDDDEWWLSWIVQSADHTISWNKRHITYSGRACMGEVQQSTIQLNSTQIKSNQIKTSALRRGKNRRTGEEPLGVEERTNKFSPLQKIQKEGAEEINKTAWCTMPLKSRLVTEAFFKTTHRKKGGTKAPSAPPLNPPLLIPGIEPMSQWCRESVLPHSPPNPLPFHRIT